MLDHVAGARTARGVAVVIDVFRADAARKFFDPSCTWAPPADFDYCTDVDRFDFVLRLARSTDEPAWLERVPAATAVRH